MMTMTQSAGNIATYPVLPSTGTVPVQETVAEATPVNTTPYPPTEFGAATSLADPADGNNFMPAGIFDTTGATGTSILGVDINDLMILDAQLEASWINAFTVQPITEYSDPMMAGTGQTDPMTYDPAYSDPMMAGAVPMSGVEQTYPDTMGIEYYGNIMNQIAAYGQATAQVGMESALYSAEMAGATAATQAAGQTALSYMNMLA